jgi:hypothetical protein
LGYGNEYWLYQLSAGGSFEEPLGLGRTEPYEWIEAAPVSDQTQPFTLVQHTPVDYDEGALSFSRVRRQLLRFQSGFTAGAGSEREADVRKITVPGVPLLVDGERALSLEPRAELGDGSGSVEGQLHRLLLTERGAVIEQTLSLPKGLTDNRWAKTRGFALFLADDLCAEPSARLLSMQLVDGQLALAGERSLSGTGWRIHSAHDEAVVLMRQTGRLAQYALVTASGDQLAEPELMSAPASVPVRVHEGALVAEY